MTKNMNNKMTRNSELSTREPKIKNKSKLSNNKKRNKSTEMEITWRVISGEGEGAGWGKR